MLKQSLVQEKLSDLTMATQASSSSASKGVVSSSSQSTLNLSNAQADLDLKTQTSNDLLLPQVGQWPRVQIVKIKSVQNYTLTQSPTNSASKIYNQKLNENDDDNDEGAEYDGAETVNYYSNRHGQRSNLNEDSNHNNQNNNNSLMLNNPTNIANNLKSYSNHHLSNSQLNQQQQHHQNHHHQTDKNIKIISDSNQYDPTLKLKYLEKSIKFIQQQHTDTLNGLHLEIEKLKNENRELHFKLATRKSSGSIKDLNSSSKRDLTTVKDLKTNETISSNQIGQKGFEKVLKEALKETNIDKRLSEIKVNYEANRYEELLVRLKDAESKNEYLTNVITQLQAKRSINSAYKPNINVNTDNNTSTTAVTRININQIYSVDPLRIKLNDTEEPRAPSLEESELIIKKLFDLYKQQKQQISNMKVVLKDMMHNENLSNQAMLMTKDLLENPNRFGHYIIDNSNIQKLSILAPLTNFPMQKSLSARLNLNNQRYHSQLLNNGYESVPSASATATSTATAASSNINLSSIVHLPPLQTINPVRFPERQRRTQILQKQRLRKEYFH